MKNILFSLILLPFWANTQTEKGATPLNPQSGIANPQSTRAVIIGISDYQDPAIPDLRFADRDAEAFVDWLRSPAGGSLPDNQIKVLTNKNATTGKMIAALDGLIVASKPGDEAIIYFSGHGDVERVTKFQRGFLLTYDSPPAVYAAGAFSLQYLQDIVTTLSEAGVQAVVITDACRAGKLAGSEFGGSKATSAALAQQFANEVKILSCQPEEFSLEGEQWGGGRGCFSYHLVDALYGMADANADGTVNLLELGRYLENKVTTEAAPHSQIPFTVGSKSAQIASVNTEALAQWRQQKNGEAMAFKKIDSRGLEDLTLAKADTGILEMYHAFTAALDAGNLMATDSTLGQSADDYYKRLVQEPSIADLHGLMTRNFAAALMDEGQQVINKFLKTDPATVDNIWANPIKYDHVPAHLHRAAELLGEKHYVYKSLKAKEYFFLAKKTRKENCLGWSLDSINLVKENLLQKGLRNDSTAVYLYLGFRDIQFGEGYIDFFSKSVELAPSWTLGQFELANAFVNLFDFSNAIEHLRIAIQLDSTFLPSYRSISNCYEGLGKMNDALEYRETYVRKFQEKYKNSPTSITVLEFNAMGNVLWRLRRFKEAEKMIREAIKNSNGRYNSSFGNLFAILADQGKFEDYVQTYDKYCTETHVSWNGGVGDIIYYYLHDPKRSAPYYQKGFEKPFDDYNNRATNTYGYAHYHRLAGNLDKAETIMKSHKCNDLWYLLELADLLLQNGKATEAHVLFDSITYRAKPSFIKGDNGINFFGGPDYLYQIVALQRLGKTAEMEKALAEALAAPNSDDWRHFWLAGTLAQIGRLDEAMKHLELSENAGWEPNPVIWFYGTTKDIYLSPLRHLPAFQAWEQRWLPPYKDYSKE
jgi:hypothetical protein